MPIHISGEEPEIRM